jgi:regulator of replication initiation timing
MWKTVLTTLKTLLSLARDLEENRQEIKELNEKIYGLASAVQRLSDKIDANAKQEIAERKTLVLQLENDLLKARRGNRSLAGKKASKGTRTSPRKK